MNSDIGYRLSTSLPFLFVLPSLALCQWLFIANEMGQQASALNKKMCPSNCSPTINVAAPPNMTILYY
jgi:hypothetical protein